MSNFNISNIGKLMLYYLDSSFRLSEMEFLRSFPSPESSPNDVKSILDILFQNFDDIIEVMEIKDFPPTLDKMDYEINLPADLDYKLNDLMMIGVSARQGAFFLGIGQTNNDKIYKMDFEFDMTPVFLANSIYEFTENLFYVNNYIFDYNYEKNSKNRYITKVSEESKFIDFNLVNEQAKFPENEEFIPFSDFKNMLLNISDYV